MVLKKIEAFHLKSLFRSQGIQISVSASCPVLRSVSHYSRKWSKINLKVYGIINYLNKNSKHILFAILRRKLVLILKLGQLIDYYEVRNISMEKVCRKYLPKASPRPLFNFVKRPKTANICKKLFWKWNILKEDDQKTLEKLTWFFPLHST